MTNPTVLVGISGGIAAYKAAELVSRLKKTGNSVSVVMTEAATHFIAPLTFEALSGHRVHTSVFPTGDAGHPEHAYPHLYPATHADVFVVAPATADVIAKLAQGFGSDAVTTSALSLPSACRRYFAPAMNVEMWRQPVVQRNVITLEKMGWIRIGPDAGDLACGMVGEGRMAEPEQIAAIIQGGRHSPGASILEGKKILILSGPTCEHIDPIRFVTNASSGKMGKALAEEASRLGGHVDFISGPVADHQWPHGHGITSHRITSAQDLLEAGQRSFANSDVVIYAAAVSDYRPATYTDQKLPKDPSGLVLKLESTPDVAATLNQQKKPGQIAVGFALQTHDGEQRALEKMKAKKFDGIVLNSPEALGQDAGTYTFFDARAGGPEPWGPLSKRECARKILAFAAQRLVPSD